MIIALSFSEEICANAVRWLKLHITRQDAISAHAPYYVT